MTNPDHALIAAIAGMVTLAAAMGIGRFIYTPILPHMIEAGVLTRGEAGTIASFNYLGYLLGALAASARQITGDKRIWLIGSLFANAVTILAMAYATGVASFCLLRFGSGMASAFSMVFVSSIVFDAVKKAARPQLTGLHFAGVGVGIALSALLVSLLSSAGREWQSQWIFGGWLSVAAVAIVWWLTDKAVSPSISSGSVVVENRLENQTAMDGFARDDKSKSGDRNAIRLLIASYGLFGFGYVITATFISEMARSIPQLAGVQSGVWLAVGLAAVFSTYISNFFAGRFGAMKSYAAACLVEAFAIAMSVTVLEPFAILTSAVLFGGTFVGVTALGLITATQITANAQNALKSEDVQQTQRRVLALMTAAFGLGQMVGPLLAGWLFEIQGDLTSASLCAVVALIGSAGLAVASANWASPARS